MLYSINFHFQLITVATNACNSRCSFVLWYLFHFYLKQESQIFPDPNAFIPLSVITFQLVNWWHWICVFYTWCLCNLCPGSICRQGVHQPCSEGSDVLSQDPRTPRVVSKSWPKACAAAPGSDGLLESRGWAGSGSGGWAGNPTPNPGPIMQFEMELCPRAPH